MKKTRVRCVPKNGAKLKKHIKKFRTREEALRYVEEPNQYYDYQIIDED